MLRNLNTSSGGKRILGVPQVGIPASTILANTASGTNGPGLLYDAAALYGSGAQLRLQITSFPSSGSLLVREDGSFTFSGAPDGLYHVGYDVFSNNTLVATDVASFAVGTVNAIASGVALTWTGSITGGGAGVDANVGGANLNGGGAITGGGAYATNPADWRAQRAWLLAMSYSGSVRYLQ